MVLSRGRAARLSHSGLPSSTFSSDRRRYAAGWVLSGWSSMAAAVQAANRITLN